MINLEQLIRPNMLSLQPYSSARDEFSGSEGVFLDANENPFGEWNRYPDPFQNTLKQKLSEIKAVQPKTIFLGNGSDEIIDLCFRLFCEPGKDKALTFVPTYGMYEVAAAINSVELIQLPLKENFQMDIEAVEPFLNDKNLKLIFLCSPNNPTGNCIDNIEYLLENFNGIVLVDEAYIDFSTKDSLAKKTNQYPNLIVIQTLSKAWGLASARIGLAITNPEIVKLLNKIKPPYNISQLNQEKALEILSDTKNFEFKKKMILKQRTILQNELAKIDFVVEIYPSETNFLLLKVNDADAIYNQLIEKKIIIRNRNKVLANCLRITIGTPEENHILIDALKNIQL
ncbi:histidinol-phosphate transaminase [Flavobacterium soli]|uniref:histidinol-phosphate transaminase n=1 Tax=Flavobacterium soli TaxID=344881 RepID=UPI00042401F5|nr:histidinol-phosphate transaminase [Flavobacterium soli]